MGNNETVRALLDAGISPDAANDRGYTALARAAYEGHTDIVRLLLDHGADKDALCNGRTPLSWAMVNRRKGAVLLLVAWGANVNLTDFFGETALHRAASWRTEILRALLDAGANPNVIDNHGGLPLTNALGQVRENVRLLLEYGADPHLKSNQGSAWEIAQRHHMTDLFDNASGNKP